VNSEELEQSLRAEFENYLKDVVADIRQSVSDFQEKISADFDRHKEQLEESLRELDQKVGSDKELEVSFTGSVAEHLKLARDEGARITAAAIAEAEKLEEPVEEALDFSNLSQAICDISSKDSQSEILKALVNHAAEFTPRGAFFIVKNEHLVGWRVFGREDHEDPKVVREVFFPVATNTALSASVQSLLTVSDTPPDCEDDVMYRNKLGFKNPEKMFAVPLIARGRGVAVLYADSGSEGHQVNIAAIEALMRVAGLTVEVLASAPAVTRQKDDAAEPAGFAEPAPAEPVPAESDFDSAEPDQGPAADDFSGGGFSPAEEVSDGGYATEYEPSDSVAVEESPAPEVADSYDFQPVAPAAEFEPEAETSEAVYEEAAEEVVSEEAQFESSEHPFESPVPQYGDTAFDAEPVETHEAATWEKVVEAEETADSFSVDESFTADDSYSEAFEADDEPATAMESFDSGIEEPFGGPKAEQDETFRFDTGVGTPSFEESLEAPSFEESVESPVEPDFGESVAEEVAFEDASPESEYSFDNPFDASDEVSSEVSTAFEEVPVEEAPAEASPVEAAPVMETPVEPAAAPPVRSRFADRNLDLPIEVGESERRLHNDARRFARLLVSEIKLYNEQKVKEGRESSDLYERLREAIDRSREMYDKRVQPPVAEKFDYFNYELVNTLAEGDEGKLGGSYPGASV